MVEAGDTLHQGETDTMVFHTTGADSDGEYLEVETTYGPMGELRPPMHYHPHQVELFQVLDRELTFDLDRELRTVAAGDELTIPRRQPHMAWNAGSQPVRFRWRTTPALRTENMFETMWGLVEAGTMGRHGQPRPPFLQSVLLMWTYRQEFRLTSPPYPVAAAVGCVLAVPARALGYRA
ncbi:MAG: cupin domain-containing protein [Streptosporangiales bacterium]|nr:cupin domain-containing protein [Streptosporangiales bacterium]